MKPLTGNNCVRAVSARVVLSLIGALLLGGVPGVAWGQRIIRGAVPDMPVMPSPGGNDSSSKSDSGGKSGGGPWIPSEPLGETSSTTNQDDIQLSLQGANIDMVVQWLAQTTGKTVIKHPRVQCQLTITSSKKLTKREAITLVYRALSLEGFTATESSNAILLTPEGQEPKMSPELIDATRKQIPEGRQRLVKIFPMQHMPAV